MCWYYLICPQERKLSGKQASQFRNFLVGDGFDMLQFSVYSRLCPNRDVAMKHLTRVTKNTPADTKGSIRALLVTEHQFATMFIILGEKTDQEELVKANQLSFF